jgi:hypothetical protein
MKRKSLFENHLSEEGAKMKRTTLFIILCGLLLNGLRARGGFEISLSWEGGNLMQASLISLAGEPGKVSYRDRVAEFNTVKGQTYNLMTRLK